ncbi:hypothetical protein PGB28_01460 [Primorskyibacter aestuariivivens]|uniref:hypothetical protein n=1 Tax=Primorskyibacter aestuariivivens TaxID=1888912 RepID=UPI002301BF04|nr:hypothetical protein [Primorskyibacter aestuariivivens]MDA7427109.1 hypothetical protein [Primorskyibacter aestuariivivens]
MDRSIPLFLIGLVFGGGLGFTYAAGNGITLDGHDHADPAHHGALDGGHAGHGKHDEMLQIALGSDAPTLMTHITPDPASGWNLHIMTQNFAFSPERASLDHVPGEGHAHVYINGVKLGRVYSPWVHLDNLPEGEVEVKVSLNANDHRLLAVGDRALEAVQVITVAPGD